MARGKKHSPEQIVSLLRQIEATVAKGKTTALASKETCTSASRFLWNLRAFSTFFPCDFKSSEFHDTS
jgi:hypothetical protein